jgi:anti-anti-sigma factor
MLDHNAVCRTATITLAGDYDIANKQQILDLVATELASPAVDCVELDMSAVTFLDSTALGAMIMARRMCRSQCARLVVRDPAPRVEKVLRLTGTHGLFLSEISAS